MNIMKNQRLRGKARKRIRRNNPPSHCSLSSYLKVSNY